MRPCCQAPKPLGSKGLAWEEQAFNVLDQCRVACYPMASGYKPITFDGKPASQILIGPHIDTGYDEGPLSLAEKFCI